MIIEEGITKEKWKFIQNFVKHRADQFVCVPERFVPENPDLETPLPFTVAGLKDHLQEVHTVRNRWFQSQFFQSNFFVFEWNRKVRRFVKKAGLLTNWRTDLNHATDPGFLVKGKPLVCSNSREGIAYLFLDDSMKAEFRKAGFRLENELKVEPVFPWEKL